jgi:hypothetical protein
MKEFKESSIDSQQFKKKELITAFYKNGGLRDVKDTYREAPKSSTLLKESNGQNRLIKDINS